MTATGFGGQLVLVFEAALLDRIGRFDGYSREVERYLSVLLRPEHNRFIPRDQAERDRSFKQLIPYVVITCGEQVFCYTRGKETRDQRLRALRSIGLGGHIEPGDQDLWSSDRDQYLAAARREVAEEVHLVVPYTERLVAVINDDSSEVGRVHFGVVHHWEMARPDVRKREGKITRGSFVALSSLARAGAELEGWSRLALGAIADPAGGPLRTAGA
ncbi:MAG: phosphoesterase [Candidatus Limnocylindria bacterium]